MHGLSLPSVITMEVATADRVPDPSRSYERAKPEAESGMGLLHNDKATPTDSPDRGQQTVKNSQPPRQINPHEVSDPGRTIPRSIFLSSLAVGALFIGLHLAMLGTVSWRNPTDNLASAFMKEVHGSWAIRLVAVLLIWSCTGAAFAALLGYSRVPYGAARYGHFFAVLGRVHPVSV